MNWNNIGAMNPLLLAAMPNVSAYHAGTVATALQNIYGGATGGARHRANLSRDATIDAEAPSGMPITNVNLSNGLTKPEKIRLTIDTTNIIDAANPNKKVVVKIWDLCKYYTVRKEDANVDDRVKLLVQDSEGLYECFRDRLRSQTLHLTHLKFETNGSCGCDEPGYVNPFDCNMDLVRLNEKEYNEMPLELSGMKDDTLNHQTMGVSNLPGDFDRIDRETVWLWKIPIGIRVTIELNFSAYEHRT